MDQKPPLHVFEIDSSILPDFSAGTPQQKCAITAIANAEMIAYYTKRVIERRELPAEIAILVLNADDVHGTLLAEVFMPDHKNSTEREQGKDFFMGGILPRDILGQVIGKISIEAATRLCDMHEIPVVVIDHGTAVVFPAPDFGSR